MSVHPTVRPAWLHGHRHAGTRHRVAEDGAGRRPPGARRSVVAGVVAAGLLALLLAAVGSALAWAAVHGVLSVVG